MNTLGGNTLGLLREICNFILFRIHGCVVQRSLNKNIIFVLYCFRKSFHEDTPADAYRYTITFGNGFKFNLYLNDAGRLMIMTDSSLESFHTIYPDSDSDSSSNNFNNNNNTIYRATLDVDGVFRLYSHTYHENGNYHVSRLWSALSSSCMVNGFCGFNSFCTQDNNQSDCRCLPRHGFVDPNQNSAVRETSQKQGVEVGKKM